METKRYKILMCGHIMVDENLLHKGIYETDRPHLYRESKTMEEMNQEIHRIWTAFGRNVNEEYLSNLNQCKLVDVELNVPDVGVSVFDKAVKHVQETHCDTHVNTPSR